jgi:hypothetical protein
MRLEGNVARVGDRTIARTVLVGEIWATENHLEDMDIERMMAESVLQIRHILLRKKRLLMGFF